MYFSAFLFATLLALPQSFAQEVTKQAPDGLLVPYTSVLPACATLCGHLFDVEGGCKDVTCFCGNALLQPFKQTGTAGVSSVCGPASCTDQSELLRIQSWYIGFCGAAVTNPTTTSTGAKTGTSATSTAQPTKSSAGVNDTWYASLCFFPASNIC